MHKKLLITVLAAVGLVGATFATVSAITDGELDGNGHPYVGLMRFQDTDDGEYYRCSGTLISSRVFLTAGHCTYNSSDVMIWFNADVDATGYPNSGGVTGTAFTHPQYNSNAFYLYDLGVVVLDKPMKKMPTYGALPQLNVLDALATARGTKDVTFTAVGYGLQLINPVFIEAQRVRMVAYPKLDQINTGLTGDGSLILSNNTNTGGTCFGDSGGPNFIGRSNVVGGVTSFGLNGTCGGTGGVYRVDRADDLAWLATFGVTP